MKSYHQPKVEILLNEARADIITTSDLPDILRLIGNGDGNTWDVSSAARERE